MSLITVENLTKKFSGNVVLNDVNFTVEKGDTLYIVGENGSGKTTLINALLGLKKPAGGKPGLVIYHTNWSCVVTPNAERIKAMRVK